MRDSLSRAPRDAEEGFRLWLAANRLTAALRRVPTQDDIAYINDQVSHVNKSQVGRLEQALFKLRAAEAANVPPSEWWSQVAPYLQGLEHASFDHFQSALTATWIEAYRSLRVEPGTATMFAEHQAGHAFGPFLQYLVARLTQMENSLAETDPEACSTIDKLLSRLLRVWVLSPGPPSLRLLAAEFLIPRLAKNGGQNAAAAEAVTRWRNGYLEEAKLRPPPLLSMGEEPSRAAAEHARLVASLAWLAYALGAWATAGAIAVALCWASFVRPPARSLTRIMADAGLIVLAGIVGGIAVFWLFPTLAAEDLRGDFSSLRYSWKAPIIATGLTLTLLALAACRGEHNWIDRLSRLATIATTATLFLALALWGMTASANAARQAHEQAYAKASTEPFAAIAGVEADHLLDPLRALGD